MHLSITILGTSACQRLQETSDQAVLQIGSDQLTRAELAAVGCYNFAAAARLSRVLHRELRVKNLQQVFDEVAPRDLALPDLGVISLAVLGAAFEAKGIGGDAPLENYARRHAGHTAAGASPRLTTFHTMKAREQERDKEARRRERAARRGPWRALHTAVKSVRQSRAS